MKSVIMTGEVQTADELYQFFQMCVQAGVDMSTCYLVSHTDVKGEQIGNAALIEETLSDGSKVYEISLKS